MDWLLNCEPREVQLEALRRSYYGTSLFDDHGRKRESAITVGGINPARGWGYFMEMRLGKTPLHLAEGALFRRDYDFRWHVVLAPNAFKHDWPVEAEKFGYPAPSIALDSSNRKQVAAFIDKNSATGGLITVNYEALRYPDTLKLLEKVLGPRTLIGADESISIKNPQSGDSKAAIALAKMCGARRILTGKPVTQGPHDLWAQLRFIGQLNGVMPATFRNTHCEMGGYMGRTVVGYKDAEKLQELLSTCSFTARKADWLKTPGKDYVAPRKITLLPDQAAMYMQMQKDFVVAVADGTVITADQVITKLMKMQQISSGFIIDEDRKVHNLMPPAKNPKVVELLRIMEEEATTKVIVVCHYQHSINILEEALAKYNPAIIRGDIWHDQNKRDKLTEKARFNLDPSCRVIIGQEQALRYGHTLMGNPNDPCCTTWFYENNYSLNDRSQCEERNQGAGQLLPIAIGDFVSSPQDIAVIKALQRKEDVAAAIMNYARETGVLPHGQK
jgi:hypothetical protein